MEKKYKVIKTKNGFIVEFYYQIFSSYDENKYIARDLTEVVKIIESDLKTKK